MDQSRSQLFPIAYQIDIEVCGGQHIKRLPVTCSLFANRGLNDGTGRRTSCCALAASLSCADNP